MKETIKIILQNSKNKRISITELSEELKNRRINIFFDEHKRDQFVKTIQDFIDESILIPLKNSSQLLQYGGLPNTYTIKKSSILEKFSIQQTEHRHELLSLSPSINIDYYATHAAQYAKDREFILRIDNLVRQKNSDELTVNERSYLLFDDEKAITMPADAAIDGNKILKNLKLSLKDIKAKKVYEPFFYTEKNYFSLEGNGIRTILIVENKDTFWTLQDALKSGELENTNLVIYGEGYAIKQKFAYFNMIGGTTSDRYFYFGDLDQEGINIFNSLRKQFPHYDIKPAVRFYSYMIKKAGPARAQPIRKLQKRGDSSLSPFIDFFESDEKELINKIVNERKYLPQEIFNKIDLPELKHRGIY
ncbi:MAG: Wadjet anti-phage system protein JetD domain-containing protein [Methanoregula sp.]